MSRDLVAILIAVVIGTFASWLALPMLAIDAVQVVQETDLTRIREWMENLTLVGGMVGMIYALLRVSAHAGQLKGVIETSLIKQAETNASLNEILVRHEERITQNGADIAALQAGKVDK